MIEKVWRVNDIVTTTTIQKCWKHVGMILSDTLTSYSTDISLVIASQNVELAYVSMLLNRLFYLSTTVARDSKYV